MNKDISNIELVAIERKPNVHIPHYVDNHTLSHLMYVNRDKTYLLFDNDIIGLLAALEPIQIKRIIQVIDNNLCFHFNDEYEEKLDSISTKILDMIIQRRQEGRFIDDRVDGEINF